MTTTYKTLVDNDRGRLDRKIIVDPDIYKQELDQVFGRCWLWVAHESQIPNANDFI
ncbi:MAG: aromatic ring-hydroxylating dioxygenase subunit alpha, partial [Dehalococcoidia bacterium]|nr:aromatic ring-hydroxylating dioxygenase subunit alpha [Dehalococcoidia bacterium]